MVTDVLVVEDDLDAQELIRQTLEEAGYRVATASTGRDALAYLTGEASTRLILLDLMMPIMDGWTFLTERHQRASVANIPVIVVSADIDRARAWQLGVIAVVAKPVAPATLVRLVSTILRRSP